jgi:hypothetical protein
MQMDVDEEPREDSSAKFKDALREGGVSAEVRQINVCVPKKF